MDTVNIKKYFYQILSIFAALLLSFSIAQIPVQAAANPERLNCQVSKPPTIIK